MIHLGTRNLRSAFAVGLLLCACDKPAQVATLPEKQVAALPQKLDSGLNAAHHAIQAGQYAAARAEVANYLRDKGAAARAGQAEFLIGLSYREARQDAEALAHFDSCATLEPGYLANHYYRGMCALDVGQIDKAQASFAAYLAAEPENVEALFGMALVELEQDRAAEAQTHLERAVELTRKRLTNTNDLDDARRDLGRYLARLGDVETRRGDFAKARAALEESVALVPDLPEPWSKLQRVLVRLGDDAAARKAEAHWRELEAQRAKAVR